MNKHEEVFMQLIQRGYYRVDETGRVWKNGRRAEKQGRYLRVGFGPRRRQREVYAHRIVFMAHNDEDIPEGMEINHKDGDKHNNHPDNLEIVTHKENGRHAAWVLKRNCGEACSRSKLTEPQVLEIRRMYDEGVPRKQIARMFGVHPSNITHIGRRRIWKHL